MRLSKRVVDAAKAEPKDYFLWDDDLPGFGLRVFSSGKKSYVIQYRHEGRTRRLTLAPHGRFTPDEARTQARIKLGDVAKGEDPAEEKAAALKDLTVDQLCDLYLSEGPAAKPTKKAASWKTDESNIKRHIRPLLGRKRLRTLTKADIEKFQRDVTEGKSYADEKTKKRGRALVTGGAGTGWRTTAVLSAILSFAVDRELIPANPARGVKLNKLKKHERFLSRAEFETLGAVLTEAEAAGENIYGIAAIRLLLLTGARKSELLNLRWSYVDFENNWLRLPDSKTGAKIIPLAEPARDLLQELPRMVNSSYVLPSMTGTGPFVGLQKTWERVRTRAGLQDVRLHDLRHSFASMAVMGGNSLYIVGKILGHKQSRTTEIYAHLADDPLKAAADATASQIAALMSGGRASDAGS